MSKPVKSATLVNGQVYICKGHTFKNGVAVNVDQATLSILEKATDRVVSTRGKKVESHDEPKFEFGPVVGGSAPRKKASAPAEESAPAQEANPRRRERL